MLLKSMLESIVPLSAVSLPHDYVQLHFGEVVLTLNSRLKLVASDGALIQGSAGFAAALNCLTGQRVVLADYLPEQHLSLSFSGGCVLVASLRAEDTVGPEAFTLIGPGLPLLVEQVA